MCIMGVDIIVIACHISRVIKTREIEMTKQIKKGDKVWLQPSWADKYFWVSVEVLDVTEKRVKVDCNEWGRDTVGWFAKHNCKFEVDGESAEDRINKRAAQ